MNDTNVSIYREKTSMNLQDLAAFAVKNNNAVTGNPLHMLTIEEARKRTVIKDGNKKTKEDGTQALTVCLGKHTLPLDIIVEGATRINATKDNVEGFTAALQEAVDSGRFDEALVAAQAKAKIQFDKPSVPRKPKVQGAVEGEAPKAVDLSALDVGSLEEEVGETVAQEAEADPLDSLPADDDLG